MTTINRSDFLRQFGNQSLDLSRIDANTAERLRAAGSSPDQIAQADLNRDGRISGPEELQALFRHIDSFDRNGSAASFIAANPNTQTPTASGKVYSALSLLFSETAAANGANNPRLSPFARGLLQGGATSIEDKMNRHRNSIAETGVGTYYGDHSSMKSMSTTERQEWIDRNAKPGTTPPAATDLKESSCIGWVYENVGAAYQAAGKADRWNEILRTVAAKGSKGTDLAKELQKDGWESVYWNPDTKKSADGSAEHTYSAAIVNRNKTYYGIKVDHQLTNYRPATDSNTQADSSGIDKLKDIPFFFGLARGGMHTFVGRDGNVNEFSWTSMPNSTSAIKDVPLQDYAWLSGLIMVPPGTWPR
jgi:hypothetical protein